MSTEATYRLTTPTDGHYRLHQAVMAAIRPVDDRVLWASISHQGEAFVRIRAVGAETVRAKDWEPVIDDIPSTCMVGERYQFMLDANPTKAIQAEEDGHGVRGKRFGITDPAEAVAWLERQAAAGGFEVESACAEPLPGLDIQRRGQRLFFSRVRYVGTLRITDPEAFEAARNRGFGRGKAFGLGLLVLISI